MRKWPIQNEDVIAELSAIYGMAHVGLCFVDRDFRYVRVNQCLAEINGKSVAEHIGKTIREVVPSVADQGEAMCRFVMDTGQPILDFEEITSPPSSPNVIKKWQLNCYPAKNAEGKIIGVVMMLLDVTGRGNFGESLIIQSKVLASMAEGVVLTDENDIIIYTNAAEDSLFGYGPGELIGKPAAVQNAYSAEERTKIYEEIDRQLRSKGFWEGKFDNVKKNREHFVTRARLSTLDISGKRYLICVQNDITEQEKAEEALRRSSERLSLAQKAAKIGTFEWNLRDNMVVWTEELEDLYGMPPGGFAGQYEAWARRLHPEDRARAERDYENAARQLQALNSEFRIIRPDGSVRWILAKANIFPDLKGNPLLMIGVNIDITDQKQAQEKIRQANEELQRLNKIKSEFTTVVSHELRTPLAAIQEGINLVLDGVEGPITPEQAWSLGLAQKNVVRLGRLISGVLDFSRIESGKMKIVFSRANLNELVGEICELMQVVIRKKGVSFECLTGEPVFAVCDTDKIRQILINLLDNAVKYTEAQGRIWIRLYQVGEQACIEVGDTGLGIKSEDQEKIFEMFGQSTEEGLMKKTGGFGVGLAICKKLIEQHHGRIKVKSKPNAGSVFTVLFPVTQEEPVADLASSVRA